MKKSTRQIAILTSFRVAIVTIPLLAACGEPLPEMPRFDENRAWNYLGQQVAFGPRVAGHAPHTRQLRWMRDQLEFLADTVEVQYFTHTAGGERPVQHANVLARWRPELTDRVLLVTHWDTRLLADRDPDPLRRSYPVPGANEGASGTAVLMELASLFREQAPPVGVDLLFTDGSDSGRDSTQVRLGAQHYVATLGNGPRPRWAVYVDRVGDLELRLPREPRSTPEVADRLWGMAERLGYDSIWLPETGRPVGGDHTVLLAAGIPTAAVIDPEYGPGDRYWRTRSDRLDNTRRRSLAHAGEVLAAAVYAETPKP